ncbi:MAG: site-specific DNA-methyltransferase [Burkholderiales bacterium]|nr:site-specific DNA-methyltransferase [Burkholderiales bacterium]
MNIKEKAENGERLLHFTKSRKFKMNQENVMAPMGDWVLNPFMGSGITLKAASTLGRNAVGIEILAEYCAQAKTLFEEKQYALFEKRASYGN